MKIAEYKQTGTRTEQRVIHHDAYEEYDEATDSTITREAYDETVEVEVPVMGVVYRDMTAEEEAQALAEHEQIPAAPSTEERLTELEAAVDALLNGVTE